MADWITEAAAELDRFEAPHIAKKRATVIALVDARLAQRSEETVWKRSDTCSRMIYHGKWKFDPVFADVLANVTAAARTWQDTRAIRALAQASERLALASPAAVGKAIEQMGSDDARVVLSAAFGILDRAGKTTSVKGPAANNEAVTGDQFARMRADAQARAAELETEALSGWNPARSE